MKNSKKKSKPVSAATGKTLRVAMLNLIWGQPPKKRWKKS